jgi:hypothetical protein
VSEVEWRNDEALRVFIERKAGDFFDQRAEDDEVDVAVDELHTGRMNGLDGRMRAYTLPACLPMDR